jgi:iron complex outermembrane receptor protein
MSAPHTANLWMRRDFPNGGYLGGGFNGVWDQTILPDGPASSRQSYVLVNALAGLSWSSGGHRYSAELMGKNLGGAHYRPSQSSRARPRELLATLKVTW